MRQRNTRACDAGFAFQGFELGVNIRFYPVKKDEYADWVNMQGKNRYILTLLGRKLSALQIQAVTSVLAEQGLNIDAIKRLTGRIPLMNNGKHTGLYRVLRAGTPKRPCSHAIETVEVVQ